MRFLGIGEYCDLAAMYLRLSNTGHAVKVYVDNPDYQDIYRGMLQFTSDWRAELDWIGQAGGEGIILFESAIHGPLQDTLRKEGFQVIGGSAFGDRLEADREFGQQTMHAMGMHIAASYPFDSYEKAIKFVAQSQRRFVFKNNGADTLRTKNYIGMLQDGSDLTALLQHYHHQSQESFPRLTPDFILMEYVDGIEVGIGGFFNGERFLAPICLDWEHKRFFTGNLGELTGEMGTVVTYRGGNAIFQQSLAHLVPALKQSGYCGYINLNMMINQDGIWPLEFTSRFGYPGYSISGVLHQETWESLFLKMLDKTATHFDTYSGFAAGVVLTVPPFPYQYGYAALSKGVPVLLDPSLTAQETALIDFTEVEKLHGNLITSGATGCIATVMGKGRTVESACKQAYHIAAKVAVPNVRYRLDIGAQLMQSELAQLINWGYIHAEDIS